MRGAVAYPVVAHPSRRLRTWLILLAALATALALLASPGIGRSSVAPVGPAGPVLAPAATSNPTTSVPDPEVLAGLLDEQFASPAVAASIGAVVFDPATGMVLYERDSLRPRTPASVVKILTAISVLDALEPLTRITTNVHYDSVSRTLTLVGAGDPTLASAGGEGSSLAELADGVATAPDGPGVGNPIELRYDASLFAGPTIAQGWSADYPALGVTPPVSALEVDGARAADGVTFVSDPALSAATAFARALGERGIQVGAPQPGVVGDAPVIAATTSIPVASMVQRMLTDSDNGMAETLGQLAGVARSGTGTFTTAAEAINAALRDIDISTADITLYDGSGLSVDNTVPVRTFAQVLSAMVRNPALWWAWPVPSAMPIAGVTGTLANRFYTEATFAGLGLVRAKTGTLTGVSALAGSVVDRDGRLLVFAFIADGASDVAASRDVLDRAAAVLARCGCRAA